MKQSARMYLPCCCMTDRKWVLLSLNCTLCCSLFETNTEKTAVTRGKHLSEHRCKERKTKSVFCLPWDILAVVQSLHAAADCHTVPSSIGRRVWPVHMAIGTLKIRWSDIPQCWRARMLPKCFETLKSTWCVRGVHIQYLQGGDLVFEHFLGLVEVWQHVLRLSAVDGAQLSELPLVSLGQLLFVGPEERRERMVGSSAGCQYW